MLFPTHLAAAAALGLASRLPTPWLVVGAALPDLIDKPLGASGFVELYHSVGHSALLAPLFVLIALYGRPGVAVAVGWGSHLCLDAFHVVINGRPGHTLAFLWPLAEPADPLGIPPGAFFQYYVGTPSFYVEILLWLVLVAAFVAGRFPGRPSSRSG
jgi:hypothetical protein